MLRRLQHGASSCAETVALTPSELFLRVVLGVACLLMAALFSGLTLGVMGLDVNDLEIMKSGGTEEERRDAALIAPVRAKGNLLLCTLVLGNVAVTSLESILLAGLTDGLTGFLLSTVLVVVFGEIIPQAVCARYAMRIGAASLPLLNVFLFLFYPFAKPLSMVLDYVLGEEEGMSYNRAKLQKLVAMHLASKQLAASEASIITNALAYREKTVAQVCTPASDMFTLRASDRLNQELMTAIFEMGYSRIPVLDASGERVVGVLHAKDLVLIHPSDAQPVISVVHFFGREAFNTVANTEVLENVMRIFTTSKQPFAIVHTASRSSASSGAGAGAAAAGTITTALAGLITMQDILREIIGEDIDKAREDVQGVGAGGKARLHAVASAAAQASDVAQAALRLGQQHQQLQQHQLHHPGFSADHHLTAVPNGLTSQQTRAMAAHLCTNVEAFRRLGVAVEAVQVMLAACPVQDFLGPAAGPLALLRGSGGGEGGAAAAAAPAVGAAAAAAAAAGTGAGAGAESAGGAEGAAGEGGAVGAEEDGEALARAGALPRVLFQRGKLTDWCCVILSGTVSITSGEDAVPSSAGPWDVLAERVLLMEEFSAPGYRVDFEARPSSRIVHALCISRSAFNTLLSVARPAGRGGGGGAGAAAAAAAARGVGMEAGGGAQPLARAHSTALAALLPHRGPSTRTLRSPTTSALGSPTLEGRVPQQQAQLQLQAPRSPEAVFVPVSSREFELK